MNAPVCLVTGAGRGIGAAVAEAAARAGYVVCVNYVTDADSADSVVARIRSAGGQAVAVAADVASEADVMRLFAACDELGSLALLVNNAGVPAGYGTVADIDVAATRRMLEVNVLGALTCSREAVRRMARSCGGDGGSIVNVSSAAARLGGAGDWVDYAASKGAMDTMTLGLAREVAADGIRVNAVRPGIVDTDFNERAAPGRVGRMAPSVPIGRAGRPDEIAEAVMWLASDAASFTTGAIVDVSGGR